MSHIFFVNISHFDQKVEEICNKDAFRQVVPLITD